MRAQGLLCMTVAVALAGAAWAEEPAPRVPAPGAPPPMEGSVEGLQPVAPAPLPPGAVGVEAPPPPGVGLYPCAPPPTAQEIGCRGRSCVEGGPEYLWAVYAPAGNFRVPWTGEYNPRGLDDHWSFFGGESVTYDSNIFLEEDGEEEDDFISHTSAGVSYRREGSAYHVAMSLVGTYDWYLDHEDLNFFNVFGILDAGWRGSCTYVNVSNRVSYSQDPILVVEGTPTGVSPRERELDDYVQNDFGIRAGYEGCRWRAEVGYSLGLFWADGGILDAFNHLSHGFRGRFDYYLTPKFSLGATGGVRFLTFDDDSHDDFTVYDVGGTFSWRPTAKLGVQGSVGVALAEDGESEESWTADIGVSYAATSKLTIDASYRRSFEPSFGAQAQIQDVLFVRADAAIAPSWAVDVSAGVQMGDVIDSLEEGTRDHTIFFAGAALHHSFNCWLTGDLSYLYRNQDSEDGGLDYEVHRVTLGLTIVL